MCSQAKTEHKIIEPTVDTLQKLIIFVASSISSVYISPLSNKPNLALFFPSSNFTSLFASHLHNFVLW